MLELEGTWQTVCSHTHLPQSRTPESTEGCGRSQSPMGTGQAGKLVS